MARRRGSGKTNPARNPEGLGVGALTDGPLPHGARGMVEGMAVTPDGPPPPPGPAGGAGGSGGTPGADMDLFGPTSQPQQPITAGLDSGPGSNGMVLADDVDVWLRVAYEQFPHPDLALLLETREF